MLLSGPEGVGKATLVRSVAQAENVKVVPVAAPNLAVLDPNVAVARLREAIRAASGPTVLLITDVDALLPATTPPPVATVVLEELRAALRRDRLAVVATTARAESADPRLRAADLLDRELGLALPDAKTRRELLNVLLRDVPLEPGIDCGALAERTPGFVAADLIALRRDAALRAALRQREEDEPRVSQQDLVDALATVRPVSMSTSDNLATGGLTLDDVGNMVDVKQSLTEAVLWPLRYPDSFARLGVEPPRGVLLYGPPGGGKTFLVRALGRHRRAQRVRRQGRRADGQVGRRVGARGAGAVPPRRRGRAVADLPGRDRRAGPAPRPVVGLRRRRPRGRGAADRARRRRADARGRRPRRDEPARAGRPGAAAAEYGWSAASTCRRRTPRPARRS